MTTPAFPPSIRVVDSHTEGEPTRVVVEGWRQPAGATMAERRDALAAHADHLRSAVVCEPRGHDAMVGALLTPPVTPDATAGVIFFNNVGYLGMCGHGTIGVIRTLEHLGRISTGRVSLDTPVGPVSAVLDADGAVTIRNVPSYCHALDVAVEVPGVGTVLGDVAYGGNWFFITHLDAVPVALSHVDELTRLTRAIMDALHAQGITGAGGAAIDHVELSASPGRPDADSRNFVLCPGGAYDRSPCGTGTSARMAALHARGALAVGAQWRQESITGSLFTGWLEQQDGKLTPCIRGTAHVTGESTLLFDPADPFRAGFTATG
ncbi:MAG TPA: proline racemase family protein [Gemmatimonadales bacterium]|nr:proline racemase family protein [Gemmatimonadales bacterium]